MKCIQVALTRVCLSMWAILSFDWNMEFKMLSAREYKEFPSLKSVGPYSVEIDVWFHRIAG